MIDSSAMESRFNRAVEYEKAGDYMRALHEYISLSEMEPPLRSALVNLGSLYSRMGKLDSAMSCYTRAISVEEDYLCWFNVGSLHYKKNEYKQAVISLEKSRKINEGFVLSVLVMGLSYSRLGNTHAAEKCFSDVLSSCPNNEVALTGLAILCYDNGKLNQALDLTDRLLALKPVNAGMKKLRAKILFSLGKNCETAESIKSIREEDCGYRSFDNFVQSVPVELFDDRFGSITDKIGTLENRIAEQEAPEDMVALSLCYLFKGEPDKAIDCLFKARENGV